MPSVSELLQYSSDIQETDAMDQGSLAAPELRFGTTRLCVANVDTVTAALTLGDACALNFANAYSPGGDYFGGSRAQEEDLCRLLPQLHQSLATSDGYPLEPGTALLTRDLLAVRAPGSYKLRHSAAACCVVSAAMPNM